MCDINCIWLFNILVAVVLIILQQQQHVVASKQHRQQQQRQYQYASPYDGISSYAAANAVNYLHRSTFSSSSSKPTHNVVKREIKNIKNTDFISYLNDFNIQDETSIPEDIIDQQHLQEIIDKQQHQDIKNQQQHQQQQQLQQRYAGDNSAATGSGVLNADDDIIDVNLPYDDSNDADADADDGDAADIILESQRSSEGNDDDKNSKNNNNFKNNNNKNIYNDSNELDSEENAEIDKNMKNKHFKRTNNKKETFKAGKSLKTSNINSHNNNKNDNKNQQVAGIVLKQNDIKDNSNQYDSSSSSSLETHEISEDTDEEDKFELDEDDDDDGSAEYERFKKQRELQQKQQQQQQMNTLKTIINKKPFNSPDSHEEMVNNDGEENNDKIKHNGDNPEAEAAAAASDNNNRRRNLRDYEIFRKHLEEQQKLLKLQQQHQQQQQQQQPKVDAIGDIEENENFNNFKTSNDNNNNNINMNSNSNSNNNNNKNNNENMNKNVANIFIPRKMKRHNGAARLDDATNRYTRLKQEQQQQQPQPPLKSQINTDTDDIARIELKHHPDAVAKVSTQEENFKKKYYDILKENSTTSSAVGHLHLQHYRHPTTGDTNPKDFNFNDENIEKDDGEEESTHEMKKRQQQQQQQQQQQTAFDMEKILRRNNKRYGHKTHKKKYKDYLRYSQIMMMTTPPSTSTISPPLKETTMKSFKDNRDVVEDLNALRDKHLQKLKLEKIKSLIPAAPIFILKPREEKENGEQLKEQEKVEQSTGKPFYEGQINYFLETPDDDSERANEVRFITKGERMDTNDWYRKLSPVLRNGNKRLSPNGEERSATSMSRARAGYAPYHHYRPRQHGHGQTRNHHYHEKHHHHQPHHHQIIKHSRHHAYQRKVIPKRLATTTTPLPPPSRKQMDIHNGIGEMGHQITDIKDLDRYYAKWPHLAKVQSQLHEEQMREQQQLENYPEYEYDNDDYFEENDNKDDNLPPYIRKFNRRNKQLLDLLEGTIAPPTKPPQQLRWAGSKLQTPARDTSVGSMSVRIDDDYLKEKRKRYHQRQRQIQDLFAQQRTSTTTQPPPPYPYINAKGDNDDDMTHTGNHLPDEDVSISLESTEHDNDYSSRQSGSSSAVKNAGSGSGSGDGGNNGDEDSDNDEQEIWQKEIETKTANMANGNLPATNWQMEKLITSTPTATGTGGGTTKKSAIHKLPSYPSIAGGYMNRPRSRSSQFAPSSGSEYRRPPLPYLNSNKNDNMINNHNNFINAGGFVAYNNNNKAPVLSKTINGRFSANTPNDYNRQQTLVTTTASATTDLAKTHSSSSSNSNSNQSSSTTSSTANTSTSPSSVTNSFIYHRVVDASPRLVGAGFIAGRKQRLPFVAITDRRLETSKKSLTDHQKDFEQNHYPLP